MQISMRNGTLTCLIRSQVMVEYGPEELGGKTYICPLRSVEISRGRSERELHEWEMVFSLYSYFETGGIVVLTTTLETGITRCRP
jgi:hypothetical protein